MTEKKQEQNEQTIQRLPEQELEEVNGGYWSLVGDSDSHLYKRLGITWVQNTWSRDEYYYNGEKITTLQRDLIIQHYKLTGCPLTDSEWLDVKAGKVDYFGGA